MTEPRPVTVIGVPSSAGSHNAGQDRAPAALRAAGLVERLRAQGLDVQDHGDVSTARHRPAPRVDGVRDLDRVVAVARRTADAVGEVDAAGRLPIVLGGDCTLTLAVVAGLARRRPALGLLYLDGDADLSLPATSASGVLDTMGVTHLLGGGHRSLAHLGPRHPLIEPDRLVLLGFDPGELDAGQWTRLVGHRLLALPAPVVRDDPRTAAAAAVRHLEQHGSAFVLHFDVDVLDTGAFPLANFPHFAGLSVDEVAACLEVIGASPALAGLVLTEVNPDHDPDGTLLPVLIDIVARALAPASPVT